MLPDDPQARAGRGESCPGLIFLIETAIPHALLLAVIFTDTGGVVTWCDS